METGDVCNEKIFALRARAIARYFHVRLEVAKRAQEHGVNDTLRMMEYVQIASLFGLCFAGEGPYAQMLANMEYLANDHERIAALYSFVVGENLGWLYRWARLPVADKNVERAMSGLNADAPLIDSGNDGAPDLA